MFSASLWGFLDVTERDDSLSSLRKAVWVEPAELMQWWLRRHWFQRMQFRFRNRLFSSGFYICGGSSPCGGARVTLGFSVARGGRLPCLVTSAGVSPPVVLEGPCGCRVLRLCSCPGSVLRPGPFPCRELEQLHFPRNAPFLADGTALCAAGFELGAWPCSARALPRSLPRLLFGDGLALCSQAEPEHRDPPVHLAHTPG